MRHPINRFMESLVHKLALCVSGCRDIKSAVWKLDRNEPGYDWIALHQIVNEVIHLEFTDEAYTIPELQQILREDIK